MKKSSIIIKKILSIGIITSFVFTAAIGNADAIRVPLQGGQRAGQVFQGVKGDFKGNAALEGIDFDIDNLPELIAHGYYNEISKRQILIGFLDKNPSIATPFKSTAEGIKAYVVRVKGENIILAINYSLIAHVEQGDQKKARATIFGKQAFQALLGYSSIDTSLDVYQIEDIIERDNGGEPLRYRAYALWELLDTGLPVGVPEPAGLQMLRAVKKEEIKEKPLKQQLTEHIVSILEAAIKEEVLDGAESPAEYLMMELSKFANINRIDDLRDILKEVTRLKPEAARARFGEDGIPAVMAFVSTLLPDILKDMKTWNSEVYDLLDSIVNSDMNRAIFEKGEIELNYKNTRTSALVFSRYYDGRRIFIPIHFAKRSYSDEDGKVWVSIVNMDLGYSGEVKHRIFDHVMGIFYPREHSGSELAAKWDIGIPVIPGKIDRSGLIQKGWRFQILEIDANLPENLAWFKDPERVNVAISLPISSLRGREGYSGIGKFTYIPAYFLNVLKPKGVNIILNLPFLKVLEESPFAPVSMFALNELLIDWHAVEEVKGDSDLTGILSAPANEQRSVHYGSVAERERRVMLEAYQQFKNNQLSADTNRAKAFNVFIKSNSFWLDDYTEFMVLHDIIGKPSIEWQDQDIKRAKSTPRYQEMVGMYKYAQWIAYSQLQDSLELVHQYGGREIIDMPMFLSKDNVYAWKHQEYFKDIKTRNPGIIRNGLEENWKELALWSWSALKEDRYEFILRGYRHWLDFGFDGSRLDAIHFAYSFGNGQMASGDEPGDDYVKRLGEMALEKGKLFAAEAFEGMGPAVRKFGIMIIGEDWQVMSSHDDARHYKTRPDFMSDFNRRLFTRASGMHARVISFAAGDEYGDSVPIKIVRGKGNKRVSLWRYIIPAEGDGGYNERVAFEIGSDIRDMVSSYREYRRAKKDGDIWRAQSAILSSLRYASNLFIKKEDGSVQIMASSLDWFQQEWGRDTFISLPGLLLSTGRYDEAKNIFRRFAGYLVKGLIPNRAWNPNPNIRRPVSFEYNTADASMWFIDSINKYIEATGDLEFAMEMFPYMKSIIDNYKEGSAYYSRNNKPHKIYMDTDGLIVSPVQSTWMDADPGGRGNPITPRNGKAVEINALWYSNLRFMAHVAGRLEDTASAKQYNAFADKTKEGFQKFWNEEGEYLYDVIDTGSSGKEKDGSIRPNMLYAISLGGDLLLPEQEAKALETAKNHLFTPYGIRTLSPVSKNPLYHGRYNTSDPVDVKDLAYHQGTAWPFLMGAYIDSMVKVRKKEGASAISIQNELRSILTPLIDYLMANEHVSLPELFDGDAPQNQGGTRSQAWSIAEILRVLLEYDILKEASEQVSADINQPPFSKPIGEPNPLIKKDIVDVPVREYPRPADWAKEAVIYEIDIRGYAMVRQPNGEIKTGTLADIETNLEAISAMIRIEKGSEVIPTIYLKGVYPIGLKNRHYDGSQFSIKDHMGVNPDIGTEEDFRRLVKKAHSLGMRVIIDGVFNHSSRDSVALANHSDWFIWHNSGTVNAGSDGSSHWDDTAQFNHLNPELRQYLIDSTLHLIDMGVDGFRVDAAWGLLKKYLYEHWKHYWKISWDEFNRQMPDEFLKELVARANEKSPGTYFLMESFYQAEELEALFAPGDQNAQYVISYLGAWLSGHNPGEGALDMAINRWGGRLVELKNCLREGFQSAPLRYADIENHDTRSRAILKFGKGGAVLSLAVLLATRAIPVIFNGQMTGTGFQVSMDQVRTTNGQLGGVHWDERDDDYAIACQRVLASIGSDIVFRKGDMYVIDVIDPNGNESKDAIAILRVWRDDKGNLQRRIFIANFSNKETSCYVRFPEAAAITPYDEYGLRDLVTGDMLSRSYPGEYTGRKLGKDGLYVKLQALDKEIAPSAELPFMQVFNLFSEDRALEPLFQELSNIDNLDDLHVFETRYAESSDRIRTAIFERTQDIIIADLERGRAKLDELRVEPEMTRVQEARFLKIQETFIIALNDKFVNNFTGALWVDKKAGEEFKPENIFFRRLLGKEELEFLAGYLGEEETAIKVIAETILADYIKHLPPRPLSDLMDLTALSLDGSNLKKYSGWILEACESNPGYSFAQNLDKKYKRGRLVFVTSEVAPFTQKGGMGQVMSSLPQALARLGYEVILVMPQYRGLRPSLSGISEADLDKRLVTTIQQLPVSVGQGEMAALKWLVQGEITMCFVDARHHYDETLHGGDVYRGAEYYQDGGRFGFLAKASLEAMEAMNIRPDIIVSNDWHAAALTVFLKDSEEYRKPFWKGVKVVQIIHVLKALGDFGKGLMDYLRLPWSAFHQDRLEQNGQVVLLKGGLSSADMVVTVSKTYAKEITNFLGEGLEWLLRRRDREGRLRGILNRVDISFWRPDNPDKVAHPYTAATALAEKRKNKLDFQRKYNAPGVYKNSYGYLAVNPEALLIGMIGSRGVDQKGVDIAIGAISMILEAAEDSNRDPDLIRRKLAELIYSPDSKLSTSTLEILKDAVIESPDNLFRDVQFVWYANADAPYHDSLIALARRFPGRVFVNFPYNDDTAMQYYSACDIQLMPSRFEPGGYPQQIALRYGTIPVVYRTGGLADAVQSYDTNTKQGVGMAYTNRGDQQQNSDDLLAGLSWAAYLFRNRAEYDHWAQLVYNAMTEDVSWDRSVGEYDEVFQTLIAEAREESEALAGNMHSLIPATSI